LRAARTTASLEARAGRRSRTTPWSGPRRTRRNNPPTELVARPIHPSAWKANSRNLNFGFTAFSEVALGSYEDALLGNAPASAASAGGYDTGVVRGRPGSWRRPRRTGGSKDGGRWQEGGKAAAPVMCVLLYGGPVQNHSTLRSSGGIGSSAPCYASVALLPNSRGGSWANAEHARCRRARAMPGGATAPKGALLVRRSGRDVACCARHDERSVAPLRNTGYSMPPKSRRRERYAEEVGPSGRWQLLLRRQ
jgi:hypothetical protein